MDPEQAENDSIWVHTPVPVRWQSPPLGAFKLNFDAAWFSGNAAVGFVVMDYLSTFQYGWTKLIYTHSPEVAKAFAFQYAFFEAQKWRDSAVYLEGDAKYLIHEFLSPAGRPLQDTSAAILQDMQAHLDKFSMVSIRWVPRDVNILAHELANWSLRSQVEGKIEFSDLPSDLFDLVQSFY